LKLIMAGGGTGGHLFPAIALAEELRRRVEGIEVVFIGARGGIEERVVPRYGYGLKLLGVEGIKGARGLKRLSAILKALGATIEAISLLRSLKPDGVIGSGGYSSAPVVAAAFLLRVKTAVMEQNALPGLANRLLGRVADRVYVAFDEARRYFSPHRAVMAGNPIRSDMAGARARGMADGGPFTILVFGGSRGAAAINAAFLDSLDHLSDLWGAMRVIHQTGEESLESVRRGYAMRGFGDVQVHSFIDDMAGAYSSADLVICRAGATSIAEITAMGIASVLIPYPYAADDHQTVNAMCLVNSGAAAIIMQGDLTGAGLAAVIRGLYANPGALASMRERSRALGRPRAAEAIATDFLRLIEWKGAAKRA
jgi:UDP-N-acetylglucosamine--N-acetylmuramyl-(pentapeptide) pyrophosphoryl-undecaprenol N-acetylglucosamine transferase